MQPGSYSSDGRWRWDGRQWQPVVTQSPHDGRPPGFFWFFSAPGWANPFFLNGLIYLIPIIGQMVVLGWYVAARDNLREGWRVLPRASFDYLERGARIWLSQFIYALYATPILLVLVILLFGVIVSEPSVQSNLAPVIMIAGLLVVYLLIVVIFQGFLAAAVIDLTDAQGVGAAADPRRAWAVAVADAGGSWRVYGRFLLGWLIYAGLALLLFIPLAFIPFGGLAFTFLVPGIYLIAAPAQAQFKGLGAAFAPPHQPVPVPSDQGS